MTLQQLPPLPDEPPFDPEYDTRPAGETPTTPAPGARSSNDPTPAQLAEQALLGYLLANPDQAHKHLGALNPADLHDPRHEHIWHAMTQLVAEDHVPTHPTLVSQLADDGTLTQAGGHQHLLRLRDHDPGFPQVDAWTKAIREAAHVRRLAANLRGMLQRIETADPDEIHAALAEHSDLADAAALDFGPTTRTGAAPWAVIDLEPALTGGETDPPPTILAREDGKLLIYDQAVHTLAGEPGSGKTWVTLVACLQQLELGHTVTMVDFEDRASRVVGRLLGLGAHPDQLRANFRYVRPNAALEAPDRRDLDHAIAGASLVILDGVTEVMTMHGLDPNTNPDVAAFYKLLPRPIADQGPAVVMVDHVVKDTEKQGRWAMGAQHKLAGIDGVAYTVKATEVFGRGKIGRARLAVSKDRAGHVEEILLGRTAAELILDGTAEHVLRARLVAPSELPTTETGELRPTALMERVCRWLELQPNASRTAIEDGVSGKKTYVRRAIDCLVHEGWVEVEKGRNRTQHHRVIRPFREDEVTDS